MNRAERRAQARDRAKRNNPRKQTHHDRDQWAGILRPDQVQRLVMPAHGAVALMATCHFTREHAQTLAGLANIVASGAHVAGRPDPAVTAARALVELLESAAAIVDAGGTWSFTGRQRDLAQHAVVMADHWIRRQPPGRLYRALIELRDRIDPLLDEGADAIKLME